MNILMVKLTEQTGIKPGKAILRIGFAIKLIFTLK